MNRWQRRRLAFVIGVNIGIGVVEVTLALVIVKALAWVVSR